MEIPSDDSFSSVKSNDPEDSGEPARLAKGKKRAGTNETMSDSSDDLAEAAAAAKRKRDRPKGSKKKAKSTTSPERSASPLKGFRKSLDDSDSDNSLKSLHTDSSSSTDPGESKKKKQKRKDERQNPAKTVPRKRSLTPIEDVDSFAVAHALQDVRQ